MADCWSTFYFQFKLLTIHHLYKQFILILNNTKQFLLLTVLYFIHIFKLCFLYLLLLFQKCICTFSLFLCNKENVQISNKCKSFFGIAAINTKKVESNNKKQLIITISKSMSAFSTQTSHCNATTNKFFSMLKCWSAASSSSVAVRRRLWHHREAESIKVKDWTQRK